MADRISADMIDDLATGAALLGTGGGGDPYIGSLLCRAGIERYGPVQLVSVDDIADDAMVFSAAAMGAPTVLIEKLLSLDETDTAVRALERRLGRVATAIVAAEVGGVNSTLPVAYAAMRGLPLLDADGMGRAFPSLPMTTFNVFGVGCAPLALADEFGNVALIDAETAGKAEELARHLVVGFGASAALSCYPMTGGEAKRSAVRGSMSAAARLGAAIRARPDASAPVDRLCAAIAAEALYGDAYRLFDGKITALERDTTRGWVFGSCAIAALSGEARCLVRFQNENLSVEIDGVLRAVVPDLIMIVDRETAQPIPTESLRYGQRVAVLGCSAPPQLRTEEALAVMGPAAFGIDHAYRRIGELNGDDGNGIKGRTGQ